MQIPTPCLYILHISTHEHIPTQGASALDKEGLIALSIDKERHLALSTKATHAQSWSSQRRDVQISSAAAGGSVNRRSRTQPLTPSTSSPQGPANVILSADGALALLQRQQEERTEQPTHVASVPSKLFGLEFGDGTHEDGEILGCNHKAKEVSPKFGGVYRSVTRTSSRSLPRASASASVLSPSQQTAAIEEWLVLSDDGDDDIFVGNMKSTLPVCVCVCVYVCVHTHVLFLSIALTHECASAARESPPGVLPWDPQD